MARTKEEWIKVIQECNSVENIADEVMKLQADCDLYESIYQSKSKKVEELNDALRAITFVSKQAEAVLK